MPTFLQIDSQNIGTSRYTFNLEYHTTFDVTYYVRCWKAHTQGYNSYTSKHRMHGSANKVHNVSMPSLFNMEVFSRRKHHENIVTILGSFRFDISDDRIDGTDGCCVKNITRKKSWWFMSWLPLITLFTVLFWLSTPDNQYLFLLNRL